MKTKLWMRLAAVAAGWLLAFPAAAANKIVLTDAVRSAPGGRGVEVLVAQPELAVNINVSNVVIATGGGLLGVVIDAKVNGDRTKRAENIIDPLRTALWDFDGDALALESAKNLAAQAPWIGAQSFGMSRDLSNPGLLSMLDASAAPQMFYIAYTYDMAPDFSAIRVSILMVVADKNTPAGKKPTDRVVPKFLLFNQSATAVVMLASPSKDPAENVARWSANGGALARKGLGLAFADTTALALRGFDLKEDQIKGLNSKDKKMAVVGGYRGRVIEEGEGGSTLLFTGQSYVHVQTLSE